MKGNSFGKLNGKKFRVAIIQARFNAGITDKLAEGAIKALVLSGVKKGNIGLFMAPGSFEIPFVCQKIAATGKYHGIITIGAVIKGETAHFEYISQAAVNGVMGVMLKTGIPVSLGIITVYNSVQATARCRDDQTNKGYEAAMALLEMLVNYK